jgi:DNA polymerase-3 subunit gamma/tau
MAEITKRLETVLEAEGVSATPESLAMVARAADGSMRDALSLTDQVISIGEGGITADRVREALGLVAEDEYLAIVSIIAERRAGDVFEVVRRLADSGVDFGVFLSGLGEMLRSQLAVVLDGKTDGVTPHALAELEKHRDDFTAGDLVRMLSILAGIEPQFRRSSQQQLLVEMLLVRFALLDRAVSIEDVLNALGGTGSGDRVAARARPPRTEARVAAAPAPSDKPVEAVRTPPTPPLRVTPASSRAAVEQQPPTDWKARMEEAANNPTRPERLTTEAVRDERLKMLRAQDPVLDAAVRELDLDLLD